MNTRTHIVCTNSFHVSFELLAYHVAVPVLLASPSSGTIFAQALYTTDTCEIYLTLAGCDDHEYAVSAEIKQNTRIHVDTNV